MFGVLYVSYQFQLLPEAVGCSSASDKPTILAALAHLFAEAYGVPADDTLEALDERERLGSTGFGRAVAIPHARTPFVRRPVAALIRLEQPVDFDAADDLPVELVFGLLSPEQAGAAHLHALAAISRLTRDEAVADQLLAADEPEALYAVLANTSERDAA